MKAEEAMQTISEALKEMEPFLVPEYIANTLAALDSLVASSKDLELEIQTLVQENFWELAGKPAVEPSGEAREFAQEVFSAIEDVYKVDGYKKAAALITARDERIRRECDTSVQKTLTACGVHEDAGIRKAISAAIMGGKE